MKQAVVMIFIILLIAVNSRAQVSGCTDKGAINYNPAATVNDGSCIYHKTSIVPVSSVELPEQIHETSGLTCWNKHLLTHNDNSDTKLYALDTANGSIVQSYSLKTTSNTDWEELSQDSEYLYIGDFGNNFNGNRTDLKIYRVSKQSLQACSPNIDIISFVYSDQKNFAGTGANNTDFDCEAMVVSEDSIYMFTKQWLSKGTSVYSLPKLPGTYSAKHLFDFKAEGLITGATYLENQRLVILCGYNELLKPFVWLLYDFTEHRFFSGNKRKIEISLPLHQTEAVFTDNGLKVYTTNESFSQIPFINIPQQLHIFDFSPFLAGYLKNQTMTIDIESGQKELFICPEPSTTFVILRLTDNLNDQEFRILNHAGSIMEFGKMTGNNMPIDVSKLKSGIYHIIIGNNNLNTLKLIRR